MKRKLSFLFLLPLMFVACENVLPVDDADLSAMVAEFTTPTQTITYEGHVVDVDYFVSSADLATYLELQPNSPNGIKRPIKSVEAKGPNADVTLMYVVNYDKGWEIISADKRAQPVLAFSEGGEFSFETANPGEKIWLECLACDVLNLRTADKALQTRAAENNPNVGFWRGLELRKEIMDEDVVETRAFGDSLDFSFDPIPILPFPLPEGGHYEFSHTYETYTLETEVGHLLDTAWGQNAPWNEMCPTINGGAAHVPVGCVAVAVAQILYNLHYRLGTPVAIPINAYWYGDYDASPEFYLGPMNEVAWPYVATSDGEYGKSTAMAAALMAHIGYLVSMDYGEEESGALSSDVPTAFDFYGITCELEDYNYVSVAESIRDSLPVYTRARRIKNQETGATAGHAFVIDGCQDYRVQYIDYYDWVWDEPQDPNGPQTKVPGYTRTRTTNTIVCKYICMNWGWEGDHDSEGDEPIWFAVAGDWDPIEGRNYNISRKVITEYVLE